MKGTGALWFMLRAHMFGNCSPLDPKTASMWRTDVSCGLNIRV